MFQNQGRAGGWVVLFENIGKLSFETELAVKYSFNVENAIE